MMSAYLVEVYVEKVAGRAGVEDAALGLGFMCSYLRLSPFRLWCL